MGRSDVTARAKREARWRERAGVPSSRAGVFGVRQRPLAGAALERWVPVSQPRRAGGAAPA